MSTRRSFTKMILAVPATLALSSWAGVQGFASETSTYFKRKAPKQKSFLQPGLQAVRFLNTAERWATEIDGSLKTLPELLMSSGLARLLEDEKAEKFGIGKSFFESLKLDNRDGYVLPGWNLDFQISQNKDAYTIVLQSEFFDLASDQNGAIYQGKAQSGNIGDAKSVLVSPRQIGTPTGFEKLVATLGGFTPYCCTCIETCQCDCSCQQDRNGLCRNCGCAQCIWCCCPY